MTLDLGRIEQIAYEAMAQRREHPTREPGFIYYHGQRTAKIALKLADFLDADVDLTALYVGALFHDVGKGQEFHHEVGAQRVRVLLADVCPSALLDRISTIVLEHNARDRADACSVASRIVQDADILDHVGPIFPWLAFYWNATHAETVDDALTFYYGEENVLHHNSMRNALNYEISADIFDRRITYQEHFYTELARIQRDGL